MNCTSPCTISGLDPGTEYQFTVIPNSNCGSPTECTGNKAAARTLHECNYCDSVCLHKLCNYLFTELMLMFAVGVNFLVSYTYVRMNPYIVHLLKSMTIATDIRTYIRTYLSLIFGGQKQYLLFHKKLN